MVDDIIFKEYKEDIESLFTPKRKYTFLVGAGISMDPPSNMPSARQIVKSLLDLCAPKEEIENLLSLEMMRFELVVEKIQEAYDEDLKFLDYLEYITEPNLIHLFLSNVITRGNYVVTTNFDYLIERALLRVLDEEWHKDIIPVISKEDYILYQDPKSLITSNKYPIYKIHGSKRNIITKRDTRESLITTISALGKDRGEGETFAIEPYKKTAIFNIMNNRTLVIMGYSGSDDFDIGPTLREMPFLNRLIWIEHTQDSQTKIINLTRNEKLSPEEISSHLGELLEDIRTRNDFEVILIKTNTSEFLQKHLWNIFLPYLPLNEINLFDSENQVPFFPEWIKPIYSEMSIIQKYKFTSQLFYYLKELDATKRCVEKGIMQAEEINDITSKSHFFNMLGIIDLIKGNYESALRYYKNALQIDESLNDVAGLSTDLNNIGSIYLTLGEYDKALERFNQALEIAERLGDLASTITCKNNIGRVYEVKNEFELALKYYQEAIKTTEKVGDLNRKATLLNNIGMIYKARDEYNKSIEYYNEAFRISDLLGDLYGKNILLNNIGRVYDEFKDYDKALEKYHESIQIAEELGDLSKKAGTLNNIGSIYLALGQQDLALEKYQEALNIEERLGDPLMRIIYLNNIGMIYNNQNNFILAKEKYTDALHIAAEIGDLSKKGLLLTKIATIEMNQESYSNALEKYEEAVLIFDQKGEFSNKAASLSNIGRIYEIQKDFYEALRRYDEALTIDQNLRDPIGVAIDLYNMGRVYNLQGEYRKALQNYEESLKIFTQLGQEQYIEVIQNYIKEINRKIGK
ncbi:MAG: tetratricopeptide repeat protein [Candidatus Hermodarchaeota archaeon]